jgi:hypothetical protein
MIFLCLRSSGMPVQDEIAHFNISKQAWKVPQLMLDIWGRPLNTTIYMLPALHSWLATRLFSIFLSLISLLLTVLTARKMGMKNYLILIPALLLFQPWFQKLGFTTLTEVPFCLLLVAGVYFWVSKRYVFASFCLGSLTLIRHEGIVLLGAWCLWMVLKKKWVPLSAAILPYLLYNVIYWVVFKKPAFEIFFSLKPTELYGNGSWFHFIKPTLQETGILPVILSLLAIPAAVRLREKGMVFLLFIIYFLTHTIIFRFGLFASGGYYLFLMPLATGFALAAALGVESMLSGVRDLGEKIKVKWISTAAQFSLILVVCTGMLAAGLNSKPYLLSEEESVLGDVYEYLHSAGIPPEKVYSTHPYFHYLYDLPKANWLYEPDLMDLKEGSIIVWDSHYSDRWGVQYAWLTSPSSPFELNKSFSDGQAVVFEKKHNLNNQLQRYQAICNGLYPAQDSDSTRVSYLPGFLFLRE